MIFLKMYLSASIIVFSLPVMGQVASNSVIDPCFQSLYNSNYHYCLAGKEDSLCLDGNIVPIYQALVATKECRDSRKMNSLLDVIKKTSYSSKVHEWEDSLYFSTIISQFKDISAASCAQRQKVKTISLDPEKCFGMAKSSDRCSCLKPFESSSLSKLIQEEKDYSGVSVLLKRFLDYQQKEKAALNIGKYAFIADVDRVLGRPSCNLNNEEFLKCPNFKNLHKSFRKILRSGAAVNEKEDFSKLFTSSTTKTWEDFYTVLVTEGVRLENLKFRKGKNKKAYEEFAMSQMNELVLPYRKRKEKEVKSGIFSTQKKDKFCKDNISKQGFSCQGLTLDEVFSQLHAQCQNIVLMKERLCSGGSLDRISSKDVIDSEYIAKQSIEKKLAFNLEQCRIDAIKKASPSDDDFANMSVNMKGLRGVMAGMSNLGATIGSSPKQERVATLQATRPTEEVMDNLADAFKEVVQKDKRSRGEFTDKRSAFPEVAYHKDLDRSFDNNKAKKKFTPDAESKKHSADDIKQKIKDLEDELKSKTRALKVPKVSKSNSHSLQREIDGILAELKDEKAKNRALKTRLAKGPSNKKITSTNIPLGDSQVQSFSPAKEPVRNRAVNAPEKKMVASTRSGEQHSRVNPKQVNKVSASSAIIGAENSTRQHEEKGSILSFKFLDFVRMDKAALFKESKGRPIEVIKKVKGKAVKFVLKPVLNDKGEFVDFTLEEKKVNDPKKPVKEKAKKIEEKRNLQERGKEIIRVWYNKLKAMF